MTNQYQSARQSKERYHFEGTKVQKYLQKSAISLKKDDETLIKRQYFGDSDYDKCINHSRFERKAEVRHQQDGREQQYPLTRH